MLALDQFGLQQVVDGILGQQDAAAAASGSLGLIEGLVGTGEDGGGVVGGDGLGDADADGEGLAVGEEGELADGMVDAVGYDLGVLPGGLGEEEEELVAAESAEVVVGAEALGDGVDYAAEGGVSGCVALGVVDGLEVVYVDEGDGELLLAVTADALELGCQLLLDAAAVEGTGEGILEGLLLDLAEEAAVEHEQLEEAHDADEDHLREEQGALQRVVRHEVGGRSVDEDEGCTVQAAEAVERHEVAEERQQRASLGVAEEFDGDEPAGEGVEEGDDDDAGDDCVMH